MKKREELRFLVIEARLDNFLAQHEKDCLIRSSSLQSEQFELYSLLEKDLPKGYEQDFDCVIIGGTGDFSVVQDRPDFYEKLLDYVRYLYEINFPILGLCYGHQILAQALGGKVITEEHENSETGTYLMYLTEEGRKDKVLADLPDTFYAQEGHHDSVVAMPEDFIRLAYSDRCYWQAMRHQTKPIYGFQFHPELIKEDLVKRMRAYAHVYASQPGQLEKVIDEIKETDNQSAIKNFIEKVVLNN
ncbi:type 1 glutamine amidotransferase [bacterium]|nr:type 1 glutamine amidotransferase [bacterium]